MNIANARLYMSLIILAAFLISVVPLQTTPIISAQEQEAVSPFDAIISALESDIRILTPTWSKPIAVTPGLSFEISLAKDVSIARAFGIHVITGEVLNLNIESVEKIGDSVSIVDGIVVGVTTVKIAVPASAGEGLYNLFLETSDGELMWMPRSLLVYNSSPDELVLLHLSDTHLGATDEGILNDFKHTRYVALVNTLRDLLGLDLVIVTGDTIDVGNQIGAYRNLAYIMNQMMVPTLIVPGNHNWAQVTRVEDFLLQFYGKYVYPARQWSFRWGNFLFIGLDSQSTGFVEDEGLDYLEDVLSRYEGTGVRSIIMFHHPLFNKSGTYKGDPESFRNALYGSWDSEFDKAERFFEIIDRYKSVIAVFSGHVHRDADAIYYRSDNSKVYFITTTTANHGYPEGYYWGGKIVKLRSSGEVEVITLDREYRLEKGSLDTSKFRVFSVTGTDGKAFSWMIDLSEFQVDFSSLVLSFPLSKAVPPETYLNNILTDGLEVEKISIVDVGPYYLAVGTFKVMNDIGRVTIYAEEDNIAPEINVTSVVPSKPFKGSVVTIQFTVSDEGWGVGNINAKLLTTEGEEDLDVFMGVTLGTYIIRFIASPGLEGVRISATDLAGNTVETTIDISIPAPQTTTTTTPQTETTTTEEETETTTIEEETPLTTTSPGEETATMTEEVDETTEIEETTPGEITTPTTGAEEAEAGGGIGGLVVLLAAVIAALIILGTAVYVKYKR